MGQSHLDILRSASSHPDLRGGYFGKRSNLAIWSTATGVLIGIFFYLGCASGIGSAHVTNSVIFGAICGLMTAWILRSNAKAVQKDYIRMMRLKGIDKEIIAALNEGADGLDSVRARFDKAAKGKSVVKERDIFRALALLGNKQ